MSDVAAPNEVSRVPLIGWRAWHLIQTAGGPLLSSIVQMDLWEGPVKHANRLPSLEGPGSSSGLHAFRKPAQLGSYMDAAVFGRVSLSGVVCVHTDGYRAETATIDHLVLQACGVEPLSPRSRPGMGKTWALQRRFRPEAEFEDANPVAEWMYCPGRAAGMLHPLTEETLALLADALAARYGCEVEVTFENPLQALTPERYHQRQPFRTEEDHGNHRRTAQDRGSHAAAIRPAAGAGGAAPGAVHLALPPYGGSRRRTGYPFGSHDHDHDHDLTDGISPWPSDTRLLRRVIELFLKQNPGGGSGSPLPASEVSGRPSGGARSSLLTASVLRDLLTLNPFLVSERNPIVHWALTATRGGYSVLPPPNFARCDPSVLRRELIELDLRLLREVPLLGYAVEESIAHLASRDVDVETLIEGWLPRIDSATLEELLPHLNPKIGRFEALCASAAHFLRGKNPSPKLVNAVARSKLFREGCPLLAAALLHVAQQTEDPTLLIALLSTASVGPEIREEAVRIILSYTAPRPRHGLQFMPYLRGSESDALRAVLEPHAPSDGVFALELALLSEGPVRSELMRHAFAYGCARDTGMLIRMLPLVQEEPRLRADLQCALLARMDDLPGKTVLDLAVAVTDEARRMELVRTAVRKGLPEPAIRQRALEMLPEDDPLVGPLVELLEADAPRDSGVARYLLKRRNQAASRRRTTFYQDRSAGRTERIRRVEEEQPDPADRLRHVAGSPEPAVFFPGTWFDVSDDVIRVLEPDVRSALAQKVDQVVRQPWRHFAQLLAATVEVRPD